MLRVLCSRSNLVLKGRHQELLIVLLASFTQENIALTSQLELVPHQLLGHGKQVFALSSKLDSCVQLLQNSLVVDQRILVLPLQSIILSN